MADAAGELAPQRSVLKKRTVGAVALVVISLTIAPLLFDAAGYKERQLTNRIPPAPKPFAPLEPQAATPDQAVVIVDAAPAEPAEPVGIVPLPEGIQKEVAEVAPGPSPAEDTPRLDQDGLPVAWGLQLASFKDERNARALQTDLLRAGYKVYIRRSDTLVRVYIGPEMQRTRLETLKESIKQEYALDGMITRFTIE